jgi:methyl-accepting chemotaxis protein
MFKKISIKVTVLVNCILFVVVFAGSSFLIYQQNKSLEEQYKSRGKLLSVLSAKAVGRVMEEAIDNGVFTVKDAFDVDYIPIPNVDPPKYHNKYDAYTDKALLTLFDEFLKDKDILYAVASDVNGYVPTHNTRYQQALTGDKAKDIAGNRTKRIYNDAIGGKAAKNEEEGFLQIYKRDTGETIWDFASPIYVKGKHWGNSRLGISLDTLDKAKRTLAITLVAIMLVIGLLSWLTVYLVVNTVLKPLTEFTQVASRMADGMVEDKIVPKSNDELGDLADVLERMRVSLKAAMDRLARK